MLQRRRTVLAVGLAIALPPLGWLAYRVVRFPADTTPKGAYLRIAAAIGGGTPEECFAYLEEEAQHACFSIAGYARQAVARIREAYPESQQASALEGLQQLAVPDGKALWRRVAEPRGYLSRLRRDLSGVAEVDVRGERATVVTARGSRYSFRRRPNGIWGLTMFTAELEAQAAKLARDWAAIQAAANHFEAALRER